MTSETLQIGGIIGITIALIELLKFVITRYTSNGKNGNYEMERQLKMMNENHLIHLLDAIQKQTEDENEWHRKLFEILVEVKTVLRNQN